jgi:hypothetical protein
VFRRLDYPLWRISAHNPVLMLRTIAPERLEEAARDPRYLALYDAAIVGLDQTYAARNTWWRKVAPNGSTADRPIAYFSAEFALHQSLPIYAGGLGVLAGDTCKEASDLGIPLRAVELGRCPHQTRAASRWKCLRRRRAAREPDSACGGLRSEGWPRAPLPARHRSRGKRAVGP